MSLHFMERLVSNFSHEEAKPYFKPHQSDLRTNFFYLEVYCLVKCFAPSIPVLQRH